MTDLRTRIAYAIAQADGDLPGMEPDSWDYILADAVIRELAESFVGFGVWLSEEISGKPLSRIDIESCIDEWKWLNDESRWLKDEDND